MSHPSPAVGPPPAPDAGALWSRALKVAWVLLGLFFLDRVFILLADLWFFRSVELAPVFWTNVRTGGVLFAGGLVVGFGGIALAAVTNPVSKRARSFGLQIAGMAGLWGGYLLAGDYLDYLRAAGGSSFGRTDPVFGHDVGFYVFTLPALWTTVTWLLGAVGVALAFSVAYAYLASDDGAEGGPQSRLLRNLGKVSTPLTLVTLVLFGALVAGAMWLHRYDVLVMDNSDSGIFTGASYIDVTGLLSTVNYYGLTAATVLVGAAGVAYLLHLVRRRVQGRDGPDWSSRVRRAGIVVLAVVGLNFVFRVGVFVRDVVAVSPNEPVIQLDWIERHVDATRAGYALENVESRRFIPAAPGDSLPSADSLLASSALRNAPLWPGFVSRLERLIDQQHRDRILQTGGDPVVYGPTLEIFRQQEKLRTYYDFLDMDADRYRIDGRRRMFVNSVRELPLVEPQPWLAWWGQRFVLFTHGWGMVMAPPDEKTAEGEPRYAIRDIPARVRHPELDVENPRVYYGEGARSVAYSNVQGMQEFDYPTDEGRAVMTLPDSVPSGIRIDSPLKRIVFGWNSRQFFDILFSGLIGSETRAHIYRTPLERIEKVAPFLYLDTDPFTFIDDGRLRWMVNGITHTDRYPNSRREMLGDKSDERSPTPRPPVRANYVRDAVKGVVDAFTGQIELYKVADEPVADTWASIYPSLFRSEEAMPSGVREHLQYPVQLFHLQFDDVYILYHMDDPMTFFNMEDMWDDGDEVLGPMLDEGRAITFSIEPFHWMDGGNFALSQIFTPENALNLRAMPTVYQDGERYGELVVHRVPKGRYSLGPEQADAIIDQNPQISRVFDWWNRRGMDVIRGHTTGLRVKGELLYVEPIFLRSRQNPVSQLKQVVVVFRGQAAMAATLEEAVRAAVERARTGGSPPPPDFLTTGP